ncbi:Integral membrane protein OS=Streptomyces tendae OX=1932 GN=GUR47_06595 PE=4 SV=1 [Streptomyces tendae]
MRMSSPSARPATGRPGRADLRAVLAGWPLVAALLPTVAMLLAAMAGWWSQDTAAETALLLNTVCLFGLGVLAARAAGLSRLSACRAEAMDMLTSLVTVAADALIE